MKLDTNILGVIERHKRRTRDIRSALHRALMPSEWDDVLRKEAKATLWAVAKQPEWNFVEGFVATIMVFAAPLRDGFHARMSNPLPPVLAVEDFMMARGIQQQTTKAGAGPGLFSDFLNQFDELMTDWVANEKRKDRRDWEKSDDEIGRWIGYLMLTPDSQLSDQPGQDGRVSEREAKRRLLPHIAAYIEKRQTGKRLNSDSINAWLLAVLGAWSALVRREFPHRFRQHLNAVRGELN